MNKRFSFRFLSSLGGVLLLSLCAGFVSCEEEESCSGCNAASPYSKPGSGACYPTRSACEQAEGPGCVICY
ncbi:MAG: hypothetical protein MUC38_14890 [Cyclobacteriaceae bacterium]|jgi:hypothetical protein|nr:hypothetical protein [Cyclobacteriaceae bacterium]